MSRTILIVDDDPTIRALVAATLRDVGGFELAEAGDGEEALVAAAAIRPELVFLDYDMPRLNGPETCRRLRSDPATAGARIVMLTGMTGEAAAARAREAGADLYLTKPFSPLHLLRLVDDLAAGGAVG